MLIVEKTTYSTIFELTHPKENGGKYVAEVFFENGIFTHCRYSSLSLEYTTEDWKFLGLVSDFIHQQTHKEISE